MFSQTYRKLVEDGKIWITYEEMVDYQESRSFTFGADSVIDGKIYKRVNYYGFIREDDDKKIYFMNNALEEGLIYDFDVNIGDTIPIVNTFSTWEICLDDLTAVVDTFFYSNSLTIISNCLGVFNTSFLDDSERKIIIVRKLDSEDKLDYWIEGIGSISGVLNSGSHFQSCDECFMYYTTYLKCYFEGEEQVYYLNEFFPGCETSINVNSIKNNKISIFPNPVTCNVFTVEFESPFTGNIAIHNTLGNMILKKTVNAHTTSITINLPNIPSGLYFLIATDFYGNTNTSKIIIN